MAQHDYNLANQSGADFRADLNNALSAIATTNSGATSPSTTFAHQLWVDTANSVLKIRNSANDAWITTGVSITADNTFDINGGTVNGITSFSFSTGSTVTSILDEDNLVSDSATALATQQSIKAYVDSQVATVDTLAEILLNGNSTGGTDISLSSSDITGTGNINITGTIQSSGTITGNLTGDVTGNASTATALETARTINGASFDGTANISFDTDSVSEGSSNLYFTNARVESYLDAGTSTPTFASAVINSSITGSAVLDDDTFATASATTVATSESIKAYVDSQVGSVDTLAEILLNGNTTGGTDIEFGDNDKAIFGTGSDLRIFHNGTNSIIQDNGSGLLSLQSNGAEVAIFDTANSQNMARFLTGADVKLFYDGSLKLATTSDGIDVSGRLDVAQDIRLRGNSSTSDVGVAAISIADANGSINFDAGNDGTNMSLTSSGDLALGSTSVSNPNGYGRILNVAGFAPALVLSETDTGKDFTIGVNGNQLTIFDETTTRVTLDSSGKLGVNTTSLDGILTLKQLANSDSNGLDGIRIDASTGTTYAGFGLANATGTLAITAGDAGGTENTEIVFKTASSGSEAERARIDSSGNVGIATTSPAERLTVSGNQNITGKLAIGSASAHPSFDFYNQNTAYFNGAVTIDDNLSVTNGSVGIGTSSPDAALEVNSGGGIHISDNTAGRTLIIKPSLTGAIHEFTSDNTTAGFAFSNNTSELFRIDSSGRVGIGTTTAGTLHGASYGTTKLHVDGGTTRGQMILEGDTLASIVMSDNGATANSRVFLTQVNDGLMHFKSVNDDGTSKATIMSMTSAGNVGIGTDNPVEKLHIQTTDDTIARLTKTGTDSIWVGVNTSPFIQASSLRFMSDSSTERARIDSSGNLLVGTTDTSLYNNTTGEGVLIAPNHIQIARDSNTTAVFNRQGTDGQVITFNKAGTTVGSIGVSSGTIYIDGGSGSTGLYFGSSNIYPRDNGAAVDNAVDLGHGSYRFQDIYATNGTIQTSDINEKQDIEDLSEAETRVAVAAKGLLKKYRWKSAVADKGDDARIHFGIMAQDLENAFANEGLDAGDYGMFISSTWTDEATGEEKTRLGVRYNELLAFIIAAI